MHTIAFNGKMTTVAADETVLNALLRDGHCVPSSCRSGVCQSCLMQATQGQPPKASQVGLKASLVEQGYFLPCVARPSCDLAVRLPDSDTALIPARIDEVQRLSHDVARVILHVDKAFEFRAGQFLNIVREDGLVRSYSIASLPDQLPRVELHVRKLPNGAMSRWLFDGEAVGQRIGVRGPAGDCFYLSEKSDENLLLIGTGTGLAPLYGIIRDAVRHGHRGRILLYHGALNETGLYLVDELRSMADSFEAFNYHTCVLRGEQANGHLVGPLDQVVLDRHSSLSQWRVYLCGAPEFVLPMRKKVFLAGAHSKAIHSDAFLTSSS